MEHPLVLALAHAAGWLSESHWAVCLFRLHSRSPQFARLKDLFRAN